MIENQPGITTTGLIARSSDIMLDGGYRPSSSTFNQWNTSTTRLFEDEYNVVGMASFDTCSEMLRSWPELQGSLVEIISQRIGMGEAKAWDGYLVLLTPSFAPSSDREIDDLRYDTNRLRKLVATGEDLTTVNDVSRVLKPLLPLPGEKGIMSQKSALERLPGYMIERGIDKFVAETVIDLFLEQKPLLEYLHKARRGS